MSFIIDESGILVSSQLVDLLTRCHGESIFAAPILANTMCQLLPRIVGNPVSGAVRSDICKKSLAGETDEVNESVPGASRR